MKNAIRHSQALFLAVSLALGLLGPAAVQAAPLAVPVCAWTGAGANSSWGTLGNWASLPGEPACPSSALSDGMTVTLAFPESALKKINANNLANLHVVGLGIQSGGYTISGSQILLSGGIGMIGTGTSTLSLPIQLTVNVEANIATGESLHLDGAVSESGGSFKITKINDGVLVLGVANSFSGGVTTSVGKVILSHALAGGSGTLTVLNGATLAIASAVTSLANPLALNGPGIGGQGALHFEGSGLNLYGPVTLADANTTIQSTGAASPGTVILSNAISGGGAGKTLTLDGPNFSFFGVYANTFAGSLSVPRGTLYLSHNGGAIAVPGDLSVGDGVNTASVATAAQNQFSPTSRVTLNKYATFNLGGYSQTVGGLAAGDRPCQVLLGGDQNTTLTFNTVSGPQNYVNCDITGTGKLQVIGNGMQGFENNDPAVPFNGTLEVQGFAAGYLVGFRMGGFYYLHPQAAGGLLQTGSTVGSILVDNAYFSVAMPTQAERTQAGSLQLIGSGTNAIFEFYAVDAAGPKVTGPVNLGSATLHVCYFDGFEPGLASTQAKQRTLIDAAGPISGTFSGLPEGSQVSAIICLSSGPSYPMRLTYHGGDGYDVMVSRLIQDTLALQVFPIPTLSSQAVTLQAVLTPLEETFGATAGKKAAFYDGSRLIGEASFIGSIATLTGVQFAGGVHSVQARLLGDQNYADAVSETTNFPVTGVVFLPAVRK